jgi:CheY-like chemotaxis protein
MQGSTMIDNVYGAAAESLDVRTTIEGVIHDVNNALCAMRGMAELLREEIAPDSPGFARAELLMNATRHCAHLIRSLDTCASRNGGREEALSIAPLLRECVQWLRHSGRDQCDVKLLLHSRKMNVLADREQLRAAVLNICTNALEAMPGGGLLTVTGYVCKASCESTPARLRHQDTCCIAIADTGRGIAEKISGRIFEPRFTTKENSDNSRGYGLWRARECIERAGGEIEASTRPGAGATFRIWLPLFSEHRALPARVSRTGAAVDKPVLIVEQDQSMRELIVDMLANTGMQAVAFVNAHEALLWQSRNPSAAGAAIIDHSPPLHDGAACMARLRELSPGLACVQCVGGISSAEPLSSGAVCLSKPFRQCELLAALMKAFALSGQAVGHGITGRRDA